MPLSHNVRHKDNICISEQLKKILNLTSDPIIIETLLCTFVMCH